jgi:dolichyl-phosphate-mannose-protein mannosyltransferase
MESSILKNSLGYLSILLLFAFLLRVPNLDYALFEGDADNTNIEAYFGSRYFDSHESGDEIDWDYWSELGYFSAFPRHPPLSVLFFSFFTKIFGDSVIVFRSVTLLFGLASIALIFLLASIIYNKRIGYISSFLSSIYFWHILASRQLDQHGSMILTFSLLTLFFFVKYEKYGSKKNKYISAIFLGCSLLLTYYSVLLIPFFAVYKYMNTKKIKETVKELFSFYLIAFAIFIIFPIVSFMINPSIFLRTVLNSAGLLSTQLNFKIIVFLLIWGGPLILGLYFLSFFNFEKKDLFFHIFIAIFIIVSLFSKGYAPLDRYLMVLIPALTIMSAKTVSQFKFKKKHFFIFIILVVIFSMFLIQLNKNVEHIPHDLSNYADNAINFRWNFYFPITSASGPIFGLSFASIIIPLIFSFIFLLFFVLFKLIRHKVVIIFFVFFIAIAFSFNLLMIGEYLFNYNNPDYGQTAKQMFSYYGENNLNGNVYTNYFASWYYLELTNDRFYFLLDHTDDVLMGKIKGEGGHVLIVDFRMMDKESDLYEFIESNCSLEKIFYSKDISTGQVYNC